MYVDWLALGLKAASDAFGKGIEDVGSTNECLRDSAIISETSSRE
jgi:hypothetical protein